LLRQLGGIEYTQNLARGYLEEAIPLLDSLPQSEYKDLLFQWADYLVERKF